MDPKSHKTVDKGLPAGRPSEAEAWPPRYKTPVRYSPYGPSALSPIVT